MGSGSTTGVRQVFVFFNNTVVGSGFQKKEILRIAQVLLFSIFKNHLDLDYKKLQ
jgi:hypothetical protein